MTLPATTPVPAPTCSPIIEIHAVCNYCVPWGMSGETLCGMPPGGSEVGTDAPEITCVVCAEFDALDLPCPRCGQ